MTILQDKNQDSINCPIGLFQMKSTRRILILLAMFLVSLLIFIWLGRKVLSGENILFDQQVRSIIHQMATPSITRLMNSISVLGNAVVLFGLGAGVVIGFLLAGWYRESTIFLITMCGAALLNYSLKIFFHRMRPSPFFEIPLPGSYSFPSGHALLTFCFYGVAAALITARLDLLGVRILIWFGVILLVFLIGVSRIYLGVHYPSDVLAGYIGASCWVLVVGIVEQFIRQKNYPVSFHSSR